jgi:hypothetical protein
MRLVRNVEIPQEVYGCIEIEWLNPLKKKLKIDETW